MLILYSLLEKVLSKKCEITTLIAAIPRIKSTVFYSPVRKDFDLNRIS